MADVGNILKTLLESEDDFDTKELVGPTDSLLARQKNELLLPAIEKKERYLGGKVKKVWQFTNWRGETYVFGKLVTRDSPRSHVLVTLLYLDPEKGWKLSEALTESEKSGIFRKRLDNGRNVYTCKCPVCGTLHGGYRTYQLAVANKKCSRCFGNEIEKLKKDIEKVDEPRKQKNIFQNRLNKPSVIGEGFSDGDEPGMVKDVGFPSEDRIAYEIDGRGEYYPVSREGLIGRQGWGMKYLSGDWKVYGMTFHHWSRTPISWQQMRARMDKGETLVGYLWDLDHGSIRRWGGSNPRVRVYKISDARFAYNESEEEEDIKSILGGDPYEQGQGVVNKLVCMNAHYGQEFYHRTDKNADGISPVRVRVSGKCKTWKTRPNEFRLPVKFGLYQNLAITHWNADEWTTDPSRVEPPIRAGNPKRRR